MSLGATRACSSSDWIRCRQGKRSTACKCANWNDLNRLCLRVVCVWRWRRNKMRKSKFACNKNMSSTSQMSRSLASFPWLVPEETLQVSHASVHIHPGTRAGHCKPRRERKNEREKVEQSECVRSTRLQYRLVQITAGGRARAGGKRAVSQAIVQQVETNPISKLLCACSLSCFGAAPCSRPSLFA